MAKKKDSIVVTALVALAVSMYFWQVSVVAFLGFIAQLVLLGATKHFTTKKIFASLINSAVGGVLGILAWQALSDFVAGDLVTGACILLGYFIIKEGISDK